MSLRKRNGWSQEELAQQLGVSRQSVSKWESMASMPDIQKIMAMSELFGVSTDYLLKDELEELPATAIAVDYAASSGQVDSSDPAAASTVAAPRTALTAAPLANLPLTTHLPAKLWHRSSAFLSTQPPNTWMQSHELLAPRQVQLPSLSWGPRFLSRLQHTAKTRFTLIRCTFLQMRWVSQAFAS